jgi:hypothetical protein
MAGQSVEFAQPVVTVPQEAGLSVQTAAEKSG